MIRIIVFTLIFSFQIFAQTITTNGDFVTFYSEKEGFSLQIPAEPIKSPILKPMGNSKRNYIQQDSKYSVIYKNLVFLFAVFKDAKDSHYKYLYQFSKENNASISDTEIDSLPSKLITFLDSEGYYQKILAVENENNFYIFHTLSSTKDSKHIEDFFNSIKIDSSKIRKKSLMEIESANAEKSFLKNNDSTETHTSQNCNDKQFDKLKKERVNVQNADLKFLHIPKPKSTTLSRIYDIQGAVRLKVAFLENGQIGQIEPIDKMPFGLTNQSIKQAKQICFLPPIKDGKPFSIEKVVAFNFNIF